MSGNHGGIAPAAQRRRHRLAIRRNVTSRFGIGQHRRIQGDIIAAPWSKKKALGLDHGTLDLQESCTRPERRDHRFLPCVL
jgi:hypothetical protein